MKNKCVYTSDTNSAVMSTSNLKAILTGLRLVVCDEEGPCFNCYAYGPYEETGVCDTHSHGINTSFVVLSYEEFSKHSDRPSSYAEYKKAMDAEQKAKKEQWNQYVLECEQVIANYYSSMSG